MEYLLKFIVFTLGHKYEHYEYRYSKNGKPYIRYSTLTGVEERRINGKWRQL